MSSMLGIEGLKAFEPYWGIIAIIMVATILFGIWLLTITKRVKEDDKTKNKTKQ